METSPNGSVGRTGQLTPPEGVVPDFDDPRDAGWKLNVIVLSICTFLFTIAFLIRCYARIFVIRRFKLVDWTCLAAWALTSLYVATIFVMAHFGLGYHAWEVTAQARSNMLKWLYVSSVVYIPAAWIVKVTLLLLIAHAFAIEGRAIRGIYMAIWILLICYLPIQTVKMIACVPIRAFWELSLSTSRCLDRRKVFIADAVLALATDLAIFLLFAGLTLSLRLPWRKKVNFVLLLCFGSVAIAMTILRLVEVALSPGPDEVITNLVVMDLTTCAELTVGLICACLPSIKHLLDLHAGKCEPMLHSDCCTSRNCCQSASYSRDPRNSLWDAIIGKTRTNSGTAVASNCEGDSHTETSEIRRYWGNPFQSRRNTANTLDSSLPQMTFDVELAMFTGRPVEECRHPGRVSCKGMDSKVNSLNGRREGWLAPRDDGSATEGEGSWMRGIGGRPVRCWDTVWDGTVEDIPR